MRRDQIDALLRFLPVFETPGYKAGKVVGGERLSDGAISFPYIDFSPEVVDFLKEVYATGFVYTFAWPAWRDGKRYWEHPELLQTASLITLRKMVTAIIRADRFSEGTLAGAIESGFVAAILRRLRVLRQEIA